jgi:two-component system, cell cycle response regulator CtrA
VLDLTAHEIRLSRRPPQQPHPRKSTFMTALYSDRADDEVEAKIVDDYICKLRKKLKPYGIEISTASGEGYNLSDAMKSKLCGLMACA